MRARERASVFGVRKRDEKSEMVSGGAGLLDEENSSFRIV